MKPISPILNTWLLSAVILTFLMAIPGYSQEVTDDKNSESPEIYWPRTLDMESGTMTFYQPQVEELKKDILFFRTAVQFKSDDSEPVFGAIWFKTRIEVDRESNLVSAFSLEIIDSKFPGGSEQLEGDLKKVIEQRFPDWNLDFSLDALVTSLEAAQGEIKAAQALKMDPPQIIYRDHPALLIYMDGDPVIHEIDNTPFKSVVNTPYPIVVKSNKYYLNAATDVWYVASDGTGPYQFTDEVPDDIIKLIESAKDAGAKEIEKADEALERITKDNAPEIVVSTKPAELIVSQGEAQFEPLVENLLFISNSQNNVFLNVVDQKYYVVLSGRWYKSKSLEGKWDFVASDELPEDFSRIPQDSTHAEVLSYVAGTDQAREAVMESQVPQTAAVERGQVDITVTYDGTPKWKKIPDTDLEYAENTASTVLHYDDKFYLVKDAVWYIANTPEGPWTVSDNRPQGVESIPPESPAYNVKYVYIYDSTPDVVYVGYTPGYIGSYVYGPTIVYGTGWYYHPWVSPRYYYPYHSTWGFHLSYNSWSGWGFGVSWSNGPFHVGWSSGGYWGAGLGYRGWWGAGGYRPSYRNTNININNVNINRGNINVNNVRNNISSRDRNLYRDSDQKANVKNSISSRAPREKGKRDLSNQLAGSGIEPRNQSQNLNKKVQDLNRNNNVFADRNGDVFKQTKDGWQKHSNGSWNSVRPEELKSKASSASQRVSSARQNQSYQRPASGYSRPSSLERSSHSRTRSASRSFSRPSGGGGGGRMRRR